MCLIHDMAECIVGDLTPSDNVSKLEKAKLEDVKFKKLYIIIINFRLISIQKLERTRWIL